MKGSVFVFCILISWFTLSHCSAQYLFGLNSSPIISRNILKKKKKITELNCVSSSSCVARSLDCDLFEDSEGPHLGSSGVRITSLGWVLSIQMMSFSDNLDINVVKTLCTTKTEVWNSILSLSRLSEGPHPANIWIWIWICISGLQDPPLLPPPPPRNFYCWGPIVCGICHGTPSIAQTEVCSTSLGTGWAVSLPRVWAVWAWPIRLVKSDPWVREEQACPLRSLAVKE